MYSRKTIKIFKYKKIVFQAISADFKRLLKFLYNLHNSDNLFSSNNLHNLYGKINF